VRRIFGAALVTIAAVVGVAVVITLTSAPAEAKKKPSPSPAVLAACKSAISDADQLNSEITDVTTQEIAFLKAVDAQDVDAQNKVSDQMTVTNTHVADTQSRYARDKARCLAGL